MLLALIDLQKNLSDKVYVFVGAREPWNLDRISFFKRDTVYFKIAFCLLVDVVMASIEGYFKPILDSVSLL